MFWPSDLEAISHRYRIVQANRQKAADSLRIRNILNATITRKIEREIRILGAWHLKTLDEFRDSKPSPRNQALIANAVEWAERILQHVNANA